MRRAVLVLTISVAILVPLAAGPVRHRAPERPAQVEGERVEIRVEITQAPPPAPVPRTDLAKQLFALTNRARTERGLAGLGYWTKAVYPAARAQTDRMVARGRLYHNSSLDALLYTLGAQTIAENVGMGPSIEAIQRAFMRSKEHRANILAPEFNLAATWVVQDVDGTIFATVIFGRPVPRR